MSLIAEFAGRAAAQPLKIALVTEKSQLTYDDLLQLALVLDAELAARGVGPGETVALQDRRAEFCVAMMLVASLRGLTLVFADAAAMAAWGVAADRVIGGTPAGPAHVAIEPAWFDRMGGRSLPGAGPGTAGFVFESSGSTGRPKLVWISEADFRATCRTPLGLPVAELAQRRLLSTLAPAANWAATCNMGMLLSGGSVVSLTAHADRFQQYVDLYRVDLLVTSPAMILKLAELPAPGQYLASLRDAVFGGAMVGEALLARMAGFCSARLKVAYGATEAGSCFHHIYDPAQGLAPGLVGRLVEPEMEVAFFDEAEQRQPGADEGLIGFRLPGYPPRRYLGRAAGSGGSGGFVGDYFVSGDVARRIGGQYFVLGRVGNLINFGGNKIALEAVQEVLDAAFPGAGTAAFAVADDDALERLSVIYRGPAEIAAAAMTAALAARFRGLEVVRATRVAELPLTQTGKIDREALRRRYLLQS